MRYGLAATSRDSARLLWILINNVFKCRFIKYNKIFGNIIQANIYPNY